MPTFAGLLVWGYEYHDDYIELGRASVEITDKDIYSMATAESFLHEFGFWISGEDDAWARVESIERVWPSPITVVMSVCEGE